MIRPPKFSLPAAVLLALALALTGCERERITVYQAPKDAPDVHADHDHAAGDDPHPVGATDPHTPPATSGPQIGWELPKGWKETAPSQVSFASFLIEEGEGNATVNISQLPDLRGREALIVNMWREQVSQPPLTDADAEKSLVPTPVAGSDGLSFEVSGTSKDGPVRIVTAMLHRPEGSWFFKLAGTDAKVQAHKSEFFDFVKNSVKFVEGTSPTPAAAAPPASPEPPPNDSAPPPLADAGPTAPQEFQWTVPNGWTQAAPGQMQVAKFRVAETGGKNAEVAVSIFPSDTGGTVANVQRWRRQLGLPEEDAATAQSHVTDLDGPEPGAALVDISNENQRLLGAIVPRAGRWWFYKMTGDDAAVSAARDSFIAFAKSTP